MCTHAKSVSLGERVAMYPLEEGHQAVGLPIQYVYFCYRPNASDCYSTGGGHNRQLQSLPLEQTEHLWLWNLGWDSGCYFILYLPPMHTLADT